MRKYKRNKEYALKVVDSCLYGTLSMIDKNGDPYGIPISLARIGDYIYFHGSLKGKKIEIIYNYPKVSLSCIGEIKIIEDKFTTYYQSAIVEGNIEIIDNKEEKIEGLKALSLKYSPLYIDKFNEAVNKSIDNTIVFKLFIQNIYGKGKLEI